MDDEEYFEHMKEMFQCKGWSILQEELRDNAHSINNLQDVTDTDDLFFKKGKLAAIGLLINFPESIRLAEESQLEGIE